MSHIPYTQSCQHVEYQVDNISSCYPAETAHHLFIAERVTDWFESFSAHMFNIPSIKDEQEL